MIAARPAPVESSGYSSRPEYSAYSASATNVTPLRARAQVRKLDPRSSALPLWLRQLILLQRSSTIAVVIMGGLTLLAYSWTVHSQLSWGRAYSQLSALRKDEPQITRANEILKEHLAREAESLDSGLIEPSSAHALYLEPAELRPAREVLPAPAPTRDNAPLGY